jgi:hypothetical protein
MEKENGFGRRRLNMNFKEPYLLPFRRDGIYYTSKEKKLFGIIR